MSKFLIALSLVLASCGGGSGGGCGDCPPPVDTAVNLRHEYSGMLVTEVVLAREENGVVWFRTLEPIPFLPADVTHPWAGFPAGEYTLRARFADGSQTGPALVIISGASYEIVVPP